MDVLIKDLVCLSFFFLNGEYIKKIIFGIGEYFYKKYKFSGDSGFK